MSLAIAPDLDIEPPDVFRAIFYGLGSDGTVGANKNTIKILGAETRPTRPGLLRLRLQEGRRGHYLPSALEPTADPFDLLDPSASFVACHQFDFLERYDVLEHAAPGAVFLLNAPYAPEAVWDHLPREVQEEILAKQLRLHVIDAYRVAREVGLGGRINTIMQTCFFALFEILPQDEAVRHIKAAIEKTYGKRGPVLVERNFAAVDEALSHLYEIPLPHTVTSRRTRPPIVTDDAPDLVRKVSAVMLAGKGDALPVSAFPVDGTWPLGTSRWEKRNIAREIPIWDTELCIQCNQCALACPHAAIRPKVYEEEHLEGAPEGFRSTPYRAPDLRGLLYTLQVAPEDCTGCDLCVEVCPAKDKSEPGRKAINMEPQRPRRDEERESFRFFLDLPEIDRQRLPRLDAKSSQFLQPLFEYSGACAGCGETPYVKLLTQLFGDHLLVANATGCSSIYGGNLPTTPYTTNSEGRGPAWSNSLFEDNAEFGLGFRLAVDSQRQRARGLLRELAPQIGDTLVEEILTAEDDDITKGNDEAALAAQRARVEALRARLADISTPEAKRLDAAADYLVPKSIWLVGGDGWAYDIGYGGLDHVLSSGRNVNVLVLDTEAYSNTGGQQSKATPLGASAKFAAAGREVPKKDLGLEVMSYGSVYVARVAFGAKMNQTVEAFRQADAYPGPSLIIAYSHCGEHGYDLAHGPEHQKMAVSSGIWPLYRFDPRRVAEGKPPLVLDSPRPKIPVDEYLRAENRFRVVEKLDPERFDHFLAVSQHQAEQRYAVYQQLAGLTIPS